MNFSPVLPNHAYMYQTNLVFFIKKGHTGTQDLDKKNFLKAHVKQFDGQGEDEDEGRNENPNRLDRKKKLLFLSQRDLQHVQPNQNYTQRSSKNV